MKTPLGLIFVLAFVSLSVLIMTSTMFFDWQRQYYQQQQQQQQHHQQHYHSWIPSDDEVHGFFGIASNDGSATKQAWDIGTGGDTGSEARSIAPDAQGKIRYLMVEHISQQRNSRLAMFQEAIALAKWSHRTLVIPAELDAEYNFSKVREAGLQLATLSDVHLQEKLNESRSQPQGGDHVCAGMYPNGICPHLIADSVCRHKAQNELTVCESLGKCGAALKESESIESYMRNFPHANTALLSKDVSVVTFYAFHTCSPPALQVSPIFLDYADQVKQRVFSAFASEHIVSGGLSKIVAMQIRTEKWQQGFSGLAETREKCWPRLCDVFRVELSYLRNRFQLTHLYFATDAMPGITPKGYGSWTYKREDVNSSSVESIESMVEESAMEAVSSVLPHKGEGPPTQAAKRRYYEHLMASLIHTARNAGFTVITFTDVYQYLVDTQQWNSVSNPVTAEIQNYQDAATFDQIVSSTSAAFIGACSMPDSSWTDSLEIRTQHKEQYACRKVRKVCGQYTDWILAARAQAGSPYRNAIDSRWAIAGFKENANYTAHSEAELPVTIMI